MSELTAMNCGPVRRGAAPLNEEQIQEYKAQIFFWEIHEDAGVKRIERDFKFMDFADSLHFLNEIAEIAEQQDHHPRLCLDWNIVKVTWSTHAVNGLHQNDFIMAAKTEDIFNHWDLHRDKIEVSVDESFPASDPPAHKGQRSTDEIAQQQENQT